jgi:hypothetical protein
VADWGRHAHAIAVPEAYAAGVADERARWEALTLDLDGVRVEGLKIVDMGKGMRRAARYAAEAHEWRAERGAT